MPRQKKSKLCVGGLDLNPPEQKVVKKKWGREIWVVNALGYCGKILRINPGFQSSLHAHRAKTETFLVSLGEVELEIMARDGIYQLKVVKGMSVHLPVGVYHRFRALNNKPATVIEFSTRHDDKDVVRLEKSRRMKAYERACYTV